MISILIGWRSADPNRIRLWEYCLPLWKPLIGDDIEVCVADDGVTEGPFSRAVAFNRAAAQASGDVLITWGADMLPDEDAIRAAAEVAREHGWSLVFDASGAFTPGQTDAVLAGAEPWSLRPTITSCYPAGILAVRRDAWDAAGGMDERFGTGYGYEDCALRNWLGHRYGTHRSAGHTLGCLFHPHVDVPAGENHKVFWSEYAQLAPDLN